MAQLRTLPLRLPLVLGLAAVALGPRAARAQTCLVQELTLDETFATDATRDPESTVRGWGGALPHEITLPFHTSLVDDYQADLGVRVIAVVAGNFDRDADGFDDLIGLVQDINRAKVGGINPGDRCRFELFVNLGMSAGTFLGFAPGVPVLDKNGAEIAPPSCAEGGAILRAGDIDGDGTLDLMFAAVNNRDRDGRPLTVSGDSNLYVWRNCPESGSSSSGTASGNCPALSFSPGDPPVFTPMQKTMSNGAWPDTRPDNISWHWSGDSIQLVDWNIDTPSAPNLYDRKDLLVAKSLGSANKVFLYYACERENSNTCTNSDDFGNNYGFGWSWGLGGGGGVPTRVELISDAGFGSSFANGTSPAVLPTVCDATPSRGITVTLAADFDRDGDTDLILGSMSNKNLRYFPNTGDNSGPVFDPAGVEVIPFDPGGPTYGLVIDSNQDAYPDIVIATDKYSCGGSTGLVWLLENDGEGHFTTAPTPVVDVGNDMDWMVALDANGDGFQDLMVGRRVWETPIFLAFADESDVYQNEGLALSTIAADGLDPHNDTITNLTVDILTLKGGTPTTGLTLSVSNDGGQTWEEIAENELPPQKDIHYFTSYGHELRWKLEMKYQETLTGADLRFYPGAKQSPTVQELKLIYHATKTPVRFSRSGIAYGVLTSGGTQELVISASTLYPGTDDPSLVEPSFDSEMVAYDITHCTPVPAGSLADALCASEAWTTGDADTSRPAFTAYASGTGPVDQIAVLTPAPDAQALSLLGATGAADWAFINQGLESRKMMHDIGHSSPVFVGAPLTTADPVKAAKVTNEIFYDPSGTLGYRSFVEGPAHTRTPLVYIGANDGMVHAINASTGHEQWAFVPHNLAPKLKTERSASNTYHHGYFVDGPLVVRDAYNETTGTWRTILIGGQARGKGQNPTTGVFDQPYYFALDVTDPENPKPLWEFTDTWEGFGGWCDGDNHQWQASGDCETAATCVTDACTVKTSTLQAAAAIGATEITIAGADWNNFPAKGILEIRRNQPQWSDTFYYAKGTSGVLKLKDASGATVALTQTYASGTSVNVWPGFFYQETMTNEIVLEAEDFRQHYGVGGKNWELKTTMGSFGGRGYLEALPDSGSAICEQSGTTVPCGSELRYTLHFDTIGSWDLYARTHYNDGSEDSFHWGVDGAWMQRNRNILSYGAWKWVSSLTDVNSFPTSMQLTITEPGLHTLNIWVREDGATIDEIELVRSGTSGPSGIEAATCEEKCTAAPCADVLTYTEVSVPVSPSSEDWPECGSGKKCCDIPDAPDLHYCQATVDTCPLLATDMETVIGETWSPPTLGKFLVNGLDRWLAVFASGYNSSELPNAGRSIYAVDVFDGSLVGRWDLDDLPEDATNPIPIHNAVPGGVTLVDLDDCYHNPTPTGCGFVDRIYVGDLEGRLWKVDTSANAALDGDNRVLHTSWPHCVVFDAGDADVGSPWDNGVRDWAPIITTPAAAILYPDTVNLYFGTGGDDRADNTIRYRFYSVRDEDISGVGACHDPVKHDVDLYTTKGEWIVGDGRMNDGNPVTTGTLFADVDPPLGPPLYPDNPDDWEGVEGDRYWSDPVIINGVVVVFISLVGKIDSVDVCENIQGDSAAYAYAIRRFSGTDASGNQATFKAGDRYRYQGGLGKIRQAANVRGIMEGLGTNVYGVTGIARNMPPTTTPVEAFAQETNSPGADTGSANVVTLFDGPLPGYTAPRNTFRIMRWREIRL